MKLHFTLPAPATLTLTLERRSHGRWHKVAVKSIKEEKGQRSVKLDAVFVSRLLTVGSYRLTIQASSDGKRSAPVSRLLTIKA